MAGGLIDPNLSYAWTSQQAAGSTNLYGQAGLGYGTNTPNAPQPPADTTGQGGGNALSNTGLYNQGNANANALVNPGYADAYPGQMTPGLVLSTTTTPVAPTLTLATRIQNPSGLTGSVSVGAGTGSVTGIYIGQAGVGGTGTTNLTQVASGAAVVIVPPGGIIYVTGTTAPVWTWTLQY